MTDTEYIREQLPGDELLAQLAEESIELSHAALKLRRVVEGKNPTPISLSAAFANLEEEIADVLLCLEILGYGIQELTRYRGMMDAKLERWTRRLREKEGQQNE
jgi:NTP pyrophosphatase (non-canonical NTP hydrolase)